MEYINKYKYTNNLEYTNKAFSFFTRIEALTSSVNN